PEEDATLLEAQQRMGNKWSQIARLLPGRRVQRRRAHCCAC
ncbi:MAG: SANT/Myb-like DNA-binding domain-containing protein, partial [Hydrogenophaga sp.]